MSEKNPLNPMLFINSTNLQGDCGGETGIRTLGPREGTTVFETAPFDHSGTSPRGSGGGAFKAERPVAQEGFSTSFENDIFSLFRRSFSLDF